MASYSSPESRNNYLNAVRLAQVSAEEQALQRRLALVQTQKRDYERSLALAAARRQLAEEQARTRTAEEHELAALTLQIENQRKQRALAESRLHNLRRGQPVPEPAPVTFLSAAPPVEKPKATPQTKSLKEQLEDRLKHDQSSEIRDTIHAIIASLVDSAQVKQQQQPAASGSKGKSKAVPVQVTEPTSKDVAHAFDLVRNIAAAFTSLEHEFEFPAQLDLDSNSSTTSKLAFTSHNHPAKYYEQSLTGLLLQLDQVDSFGNEELRTVRKELVGRVERAIEELEREVEGRWKAHERRQSKSTESESRSEGGSLPDTHIQGSGDMPAATSQGAEDISKAGPFPSPKPSTSSPSQDIPKDSTSLSEDSTPSEDSAHILEPSTYSPPSADVVESDPAAEAAETTVQDITPAPESLDEILPVQTAADHSEEHVESESESDTFLEPTKSIGTTKSLRARSGEDSDWSEVEA